MSGDVSRLPGAVQPGDLVVARNRKWDGTAHWVVLGRYLGEDIHRGAFVDDEDEFDEHRVTMAYPDGVVESTRHECVELFRALSNNQAPFDGAGPSSTCAEWFRKGQA